MTGGVAVVDAWALLAFLRGEGAAAQVMRRHLRRAKSGSTRLILNVINLGEVYYRVAQIAGEERAEEALRVVRALPIQIVSAREALVLSAARLKAAHRLSYADAVAVATAREAGGRIITGDPEIMSLPSTVVRVTRLQR